MNVSNAVNGMPRNRDSMRTAGSSIEIIEEIMKWEMH